MKGTEMQVLKIVRELGEVQAATIARKIGVQPSMVQDVCEALAQDGYLVGLPEKTYALSKRGRKAISRQISSGPVGVLRGG